jgi:hypothetical protein
MRPGGGFADWGRGTVYAVFALAFLIVGSDDKSPAWMPWIVALVLTAAVGYCALGRHQERWKSVLWIVPGIPAALLLVIWGAVIILPKSTSNLGPRFHLDAMAGDLSLTETPPPGSGAVFMQIPWVSGWMREAWPSHIRWRGGMVSVPANTPGSLFMGNFGRGQPMWFVVQNSTGLDVPIWWPIGILGFPTLFWGSIIFAAWLRRHFNRAN